MRRRELVTLLGGCAWLRGAPPETGNYLLVNETELQAVKEKAARLPWAKEALGRLMKSASASLGRVVDVPSRGGQWGHWYVCKKDGVSLVADSPTRHRCPHCGTVYSGYPYDDVYLTGLHTSNSAAMRDMGLAYRLTGRSEFALKVRDLLIEYSKRYKRYAHRDNLGQDSVNAGRVLSTTLDESTWTIPVAWGFALIQDTLTPEDRRTIERELLRPLTDTIIGMSYSRLPNIQCWKDSAIACVGFAIGDKDLVAEALDHPTRGFHALMSRYVMPGGLWYEGSLGYHQYALAALRFLAEASRHNGIDLYADKRYKTMFDAPLALSMQDGSSPGFNDNPGGKLTTFSELYEIAYARWYDRRYGRAAQEGDRLSLSALLYGADTLPPRDTLLIETTSVLMKEAGYAVLRSRQVTAAVRFGLHGSGHGHPDKLNVVTSAFGQVFGLDPGSVNYGAPLHAEWYRSTIAHNTVCVDEHPQNSADGELLKWEDTESTITLQVAADRAYEGVSMNRLLILTGSEMSDRFECSSKAEHVFDWAFHSEGTFTTSLKLQEQTGPLGTGNGYQHLGNVRRADIWGEWWARWQYEGVSLTLHVKGTPGTVVFAAQGPGRLADHMVTAVIIRRRDLRTVFETRQVYSRTANGRLGERSRTSGSALA